MTFDLEPIKAELTAAQNGFTYRRYVAGEPPRTVNDDLAAAIAEIERLRLLIAVTAG